MAAATHDQDMVFVDADDDDMPPLVDNPAPSMTFTFATDMTPITYSEDPTVPEYLPMGAATEFSIYSPPASPALGPTRVSHAKKRDASYIPRPPNAFILFRSSFIRAQHIPGKIEGNHSALSKIIGKCWKALPREEREVWEAKAIVAQAEHRQKYPDWRFRPGSNALAKVKDGPKRRNNKKGRGQAEKEVKSREKRCAKIADLLVAGKKGLDLEVAIQEYDGKSEKDIKTKEEEGLTVVTTSHGHADANLRRVTKLDIPFAEHNSVKEAVPLAPAFTETRSKTPDPALDSKFKVPLTAMFKRSSSAPAAHNRSVDVLNAYSGRRSSLKSAASFAFGDASFANFLGPAIEHEGQPRAESDISLSDEYRDRLVSDCMAATPIPNPPVLDPDLQHDNAKFVQWNKDYAFGTTDTQCSSPALPAFEPDTEDAWSPVQSPLSDPFSLYQGCGLPAPAAGALVCPEFTEDCNSFHSSYSTLVGWAGDAFGKHDTTPSSGFDAPFVVAQSPLVYDADPVGVMKAAFDAASHAVYGGWDGELGLGTIIPDHSYNRWDDLDATQCPGHWPPGGLQGVRCLQDNLQLSVGLGADRSGRFVRQT